MLRGGRLTYMEQLSALMFIPCTVRCFIKFVVLTVLAAINLLHVDPCIYYIDNFWHRVWWNKPTLSIFLTSSTAVAVGHTRCTHKAVWKTKCFSWMPCPSQSSALLHRGKSDRLDSCCLSDVGLIYHLSIEIWYLMAKHFWCSMVSRQFSWYLQNIEFRYPAILTLEFSFYILTQLM